MAILFLLPKVIVLTFLTTTCSSHSDDLLDRVRLSKSSDPEVRDFLRVVLKHHGDFRWIQDELTRVNREDQILPLKGVHPKNKRSFHSHRKGRPDYASYGYQMQNSYQPKPSYQRPNNDIYPYDEEEDSLIDKTYLNKLYKDNDYNFDDSERGGNINFLEEEEPDENNYSPVHKRKARSIGKYEDEVPQNGKTNNYAEMLLNEKLMLRNLLNSNNLKSQKLIKKLEEQNGLSGLQDQDVDQIRIEPNGENGVLLNGGRRYKIDDYKRCISDEHILDTNIGSNVTNNDFPMAEFYYSGPHDILGMDQDMQMEQHGQNGTCFKFRRGIHLEDLLKNQKNRKDKGIKIKIFDDNRLVKDINKGDTSNSIVLTIKNEKTAPTKNEGKDNSLKILTDLNSYSSDVFSPFNNDNTLQKIDSILRHDEAILKHKKSNTALRNHIEANDLLNLYENLPIDSNIQRKSIKSDKTSTLKPLASRSRKNYHKPNTEKLDTSKNKASNKFVVNQSPISNAKISPSIETYSTEPQNRLEDQTEPTSAAEQRQLGKINNKFETPTMDMVSTDKMLIIPFKKETVTKIEDFQQFDDNEAGFPVDPSKEMIQDNADLKFTRTESSKSFPLFESKFKSTDESIDKLKCDLEKAIKLDNSPKLKDNTVRDNSDFFYDQYDDFVTKTEKTRLKEDGNLNDNYSDDNLDIITDETKNIKKKSANKRVDKDFAESFKGRKLQSINKRNLFDVIGMSNDEDYSEDKTDYDDMELKLKRAESEEDNFETTVKQISPKPTGRAKSHIKKNSKHSQKADINKVKRFPKVRKAFPLRDKLKKDMRCNRNNYLHKREVVNENKKYSKSNDDDEDSQDDDEEGTTDGGNELDIIEKSQAILLHITNPPINALEKIETSTSKGEYDENDDTSAKIVDRPQKFVSFPKHRKVIKLTSANERDDDIINEILKIVNNYKEHELKKQKAKKAKESVLPYDGDDEVAFAHHQHKDKKAHPQVINVKCKVKEGTDHTFHIKQLTEDSVYQHPKQVREGFAEVESVADLEDAMVNKRNFFKNQVDDYKEKRELLDSNVFKNHNNKDTNLDGYKENDNPRKFTPDRLVSFREIVEPGSKKKLTKYLRTENNDLINRKKRHTEFVYNPNHRVKRFKSYQYGPYYNDMIPRIKHQGVENRTTLGSTAATIGSTDIPTTTVSSKGTTITETSLNTTLMPESNTSSTCTTLNGLNTPVQAKNLTNTTFGFPKTCQTICVTTTENPSSSSSCATVKSGMCKFLDKPDVCKAGVCKTQEQKEHEIMEHKKFRLFNRNKSTGKPRNKNRNQSTNDKFQSEDGDIAFDNRKDKEPRIETEREQKLREKSLEKLRNEKDKERMKEREHLKSVLNGHLILEIFENLLTRLKTNEPLYNRFGQSIGKKCATDQIAVLDTFRDQQSKKDIKHAQLMLHQVIVMMNKIVADQVHRRMCVVLAPNLKEYLKRAVNAGSKCSGKTLSLAEGFPLPQIKGNTTNDYSSKPDDPQGDFLFEDPDSTAYKQNAEKKMRKKINMIRTLLHRYHNMSENCQIKVEPVRDYLVQHLEMLEKLYNEKKAENDDQACSISAEFLKKCNTTSIGPNGVSTTVAGVVSTSRSTAKVNLTTVRAVKRMNPYEFDEIDDNDRYNVNKDGGRGKLIKDWPDYLEDEKRRR